MRRRSKTSPKEITQDITKHITAARLTTTRGSDFPRPGRLKDANVSAIPPASPAPPATSARAMPIDTAVTATAVENASAAVVINWTTATARWRAGDRPSCSIPAQREAFLDMSAPRITFPIS
jgi:hypothetical protein